MFLRKQDCIFPIFCVLHFATHHIQPRAIMNILGGRGCLDPGDTWKKNGAPHLYCSRGQVMLSQCFIYISFLFRGKNRNPLYKALHYITFYYQYFMSSSAHKMPKPLFMRRCVIMSKVFLLGLVIPSTNHHYGRKRNLCRLAVFHN